MSDPSPEHAKKAARSARRARAAQAKKLAHILNSLPHVTWSAGPDGKLDFISEQWIRDHGGDLVELIGNGWIDHVHPDEVDAVVANWTEAMPRGELYETRFRLRRPTGEYRWSLIKARPECDEEGKVVRWFGTCTDIHELVLAEAELEQKQRLYRSVLDASADCIKIISLEGKLELMNAPGLVRMELPGMAAVEGDLWWTHWPRDMQPTVRDAVLCASRGETVRFSGICPTRSGIPKWWDVVVTPIRDSDGTVIRLLAISRDSTAEREKSQQLEWASEHDALTGLPNRRAFQNRLQAAVLRAMHAPTKVGLLLIDLDHFKHVNDTLGHSAGDALLKEFAKRLRKGLRANDFVGRVGGDEFAIIVEGIQRAEDLLVVGEKAGLTLRAPLRLQGRALSGGASMGGALFPDDADSANELFKLADTALYALKAEGRGGTKLFHAHMREEAQRVALQLSQARVAVNERLVTPLYQPKMLLGTRAVVGFEALLRWGHPEKGLQLPETIEEAFKDYELASKLGTLMQCRVLEDIRRWTDQGRDFGRVSINAAPAEFLRDDYAERLLERLDEREISPRLIEIEVTEHVLMASGSKYVARALAELKSAGIRIALDDFGTGHSSLSHLRDFPVDVVKIDRSFVQKMGVDPEISAIVAAVINLAKSLRIQSVAEGIETHEQAELLRAAGCEIGQGFLLGRPAAPEQVAAMVSARVAA